MTSVLVLGGARSGKSRYAEELLADAGSVRYVATGPPPAGDDEWAARVAEHRRRRPSHWHTVETADPAAVIAEVITDWVAEAAARPEPVLVDCLGTWLTRLIDEAGAWEDPGLAEAVRERAGSGLIAALRASGGSGADVVLVSNEVGSGVVPATPSGRLFRDQLGRLNAQVALACDRVVLVVAGRRLELPAPADRVPAGLREPSLAVRRVARDVDPCTDRPRSTPKSTSGRERPTGIDESSSSGPVPPRERVGAPVTGAGPAAHRPRGHVARDAWRLASGTLTAWPLPAPGTVDRPVAGLAMASAPLVMLPLLALLAVPAVLGARLHAPPLVLAALLVAALVLSTRGMHLDGLADTCDGLSAGYDRERALAVMRTGDVGPSGAAAIALVLFVQTAALAELLARSPGHLVAAAVAVLASRHVLAWGCRRGVPPARPEGLGAAMAGSVSAVPTALTALTLAGAGALAAWAAGGTWWVPPAVVAVAIATALILLRRATSRLGGVTGDVLGATIELALAGGLAAAALLP